MGASNRIAKIGKSHLCLREENLSFVSSTLPLYNNLFDNIYISEEKIHTCTCSIDQLEFMSVSYLLAMCRLALASWEKTRKKILTLTTNFDLKFLMFFFHESICTPTFLKYWTTHIQSLKWPFELTGPNQILQFIFIYT
jgi:hypothetical protein